MLTADLSRAGVPPQLRPTDSPYSFRMASGSLLDLAAWLVARGFSHRHIHVGDVERLEKGAPRERAIVLIFASGSVLCQGTAQSREQTAALLRTLLADEAPAAEQLDLFAEVRL